MAVSRAYRLRQLLTAVLIFACVFNAGWAAASARIASWNVRNLGWQNDKNLAAIATIVSRFDLVALQEIMDVEAAQRLAKHLRRRTNEPWGVLTSAPVGDGRYKEYRLGVEVWT